MGARVDAAEGGAHPFLTAHFLTTPPPVFVFNPRHSRRPWVHSLLVQKGGGACCSLLQCSRSVFSSRTRTILAIPPSVHGGCDRSLHSTVLHPPPPSYGSVRRPRGSVTLTRDHPAIIRARCVDPFVCVDARPTNDRISGHRPSARLFVLPPPPINLHEY